MLSLVADMAVSWVGVPLALVVVTLGLGRLVALAAADDRLRSIALPIGFATLIVLGQLLTALPQSAPYALPGVVSLALAGLLLNPPRRKVRGRRRRWLSAPIASAIAAGAVALLPVVGSGRPTYLGWLTFDGTASGFAFGDQLLGQGWSDVGLSSSSFADAVSTGFQAGWPMGAYPPVALLATLFRTDQVLVLQPVIAYGVAMFAVSAHYCVRALRLRGTVRSAAVLTAAGSSMLLSIAWVGALREVVMIALLALAGACIDDFQPSREGLRRLLPLAITVAAVTAVYGPGGWLWLVLPIWQLWRKYVGPALPHRRDDLTAAAVAAAVLAAPTLAAFGGISAYRNLLTSPMPGGDAGPVTGTLNLLRIAGVWPAGDLRTAPTMPSLAIALAVLVLLLASYSVWRPRSAGTLPSIAAGAVVLALLTHDGNPWSNAQALALASPFLVLLAWDAIDRLVGTGRLPLAAAGSVAIAGGVVWSAALAYHQVWPAPYDQMNELRAIAREFDGAGPTLMVEYNTLAGRHLLRNLDVNVAGDSQNDRVLLMGGTPLPPGVAADLDDVSLSSVQKHLTVVVRRDPRASRPPANFEETFSGRYYSVWQAKSGAPQPLTHIPLSGDSSNGAAPQCSSITEALDAGVTKLVAAPASVITVIDLAAASLPAGWTAVSGGVIPSPGTISGDFTVAAGGEKDVWLGGWVRGQATVTIDGVRVGARRSTLNPSGSPAPIGTATVAPGRHTFRIDYSVPLLASGTGGPVAPLGPLMLQPTASSAVLVTVPAREATKLCGRTWDWIELF